MSYQKCPVCNGTGEVIVVAKRQMGYTLGFNENPNVLEEHLEPCLLCASPHQLLASLSKKGVIRCPTNS